MLLWENLLFSRSLYDKCRANFSEIDATSTSSWIPIQSILFQRDRGNSELPTQACSGIIPPNPKSCGIEGSRC